MTYMDLLAEVNMPSAAGAASGNAVGMGAAAEAPPGSRLDIKVSDPVKQDQGMNAYITYKVRASDPSARVGSRLAIGGVRPLRVSASVSTRGLRLAADPLSGARG